MAHGTIVGIYRLLHLIAEETHLAPQIILHAPYDEILYRPQVPLLTGDDEGAYVLAFQG